MNESYGGIPLSKIEVEGMKRLQGELHVQGSKNAALPILSASVLNAGLTILHGCPRITDVYSMLEALEASGAEISWEKDTLQINTEKMKPVPYLEKASSMRSSIMLLGSFLARFGKAVLGYPGGCCIGKRPIDLHEQAMEAMGAVFNEEEAYLEASCSYLEGCDIYLPYPSVGATENILLAASGAYGMTRLYGAAAEPEIAELCHFLTAMGIRIQGIGTKNLFIMPGKLKKEVEYQICTDRIVAGTYLLAAAAAGGEITLKDAPLEHMRSTIKCVGKLGAKLRRDGKNIRLSMDGRPEGIPYLKTAPYPGFPTDLQSPLLAVLCKAKETSRIEEQIFENRFLIVNELRKMGAEISVLKGTAKISPKEGLQGSTVCAQELRGGAALVIAGLSAQGVTIIENAQVILRGYENLAGALEMLGAKIHVLD